MNASGGLPVKRSSADGPQRRARPAVAGGDDVAVEVHRALRLAGRARRERDEHGVVAPRSDVGERRRLARRARLDAVAAVRLEQPTVVSVGQAGRAASSSSARRASHSAWLIRALVTTSVSSFAREQRHRRHDDAAGLDDREPAGRHPRAVGTAQQHTVAGHESHVLDQHVRDAVRVRGEVGIRPASAAGRHDRRARAPAAQKRAVEELRRAVQRVGVPQLGQREDEIGPFAARRQVVAGKRVDVGGTRHAAASFASATTARPTISRCTSVAPS